MAGGEPEAMRTESDKRTVYKTDCSDSISLKNAYKEGKEESAIVKFGQMEDVLEECYNFNNSFSNVQEIEKIKKKALIDNIWNKY